MCLCSIGQRHVQIEHVVDGLAVDDRVRAAGVVADGAADVGPVGGARIGCEVQAGRGELAVQFAYGNARLRFHPPLLGVHLQHVVHVLRKVDDHSPVHRLPCQPGPAAARQDGRAVSRGRFDGRRYVIGVPRQYNAEGFDPVDRAVRRVHLPRVRVEPDLARDGAFQILFQFAHCRCSGRRGSGGHFAGFPSTGFSGT